MRTIVIFSGAGLSAESGIPTFRDSNGLWENHKVEDVASQEGWERDRQLVLNFYAQRFNSVRKVEPNEAHRSIARLQSQFNVINITQNIDDLLERAGCTNVRHLHGSVNRRKCQWHKDTTVLDGDINFKCDYKIEQTEPVKEGDLCPKCGGQLRPDVVWFGEAVDMPYEYCAGLVKEVKYNNGVFICIGTSIQVQPAASLVPFFSQVKNKYIIDRKPFKVADYELLAGNASEQMKILADKLLERYETR
jgi:NAD-dependent deacetylase